jgi:hypothetical protein
MSIPGSEITFSEHIAPMFTQYDVIMMKYAFDLRNYESVKDHADAIYRVLSPNPDNPHQSLLPGIARMPLNEAYWTDGMLATFKAWMDGGYQQGKRPPVPPVPTSDLPLFLALSKVLTGFDSLDGQTELGQFYLNHLKDYWKKSPASIRIFEVFQSIQRLPPAERDVVFANQIWGDASLNPVAQDIINAWYNATINNQFGTPDENHYVEGLAWQAGLAHPIGYADANVPFYWRFPVSVGKNTGLAHPLP